MHILFWLDFHASCLARSIAFAFSKISYLSLQETLLLARSTKTVIKIFFKKKGKKSESNYYKMHGWSHAYIIGLICSTLNGNELIVVNVFFFDFLDYINIY